MIEATNLEYSSIMKDSKCVYCMDDIDVVAAMKSYTMILKKKKKEYGKQRNMCQNILNLIVAVDSKE